MNIQKYILSTELEQTEIDKIIEDTHRFREYFKKSIEKSKSE